jgi:hypothetical protein
LGGDRGLHEGKSRSPRGSVKRSILRSVDPASKVSGRIYCLRPTTQEDRRTP